jgi:glycosyltransferase involved in cell wall biosynthesis
MSLKIAIVMPAYNEEACLEDVVTIWTNLLKIHGDASENKLIVVNDGSKDRTGQILDAIAAKNQYVFAVHQKNGGHGNAVVNGYRKAVELNAEYVFQTDSDDQFVTTDFEKLWNKRKESKFILGSREIRHDAKFRLLVTRVLRSVLFFVYGTYIVDSNIPFRLIEGTFLKKLIAQLPNPTPFAPNIFIAIMAKKSGQELFSLPITHKERATGEVSIQKMKLLKVCWQSFKELVRFRWELNNKVKNLS